jgi:hypothetical protein
MIAALAKIVTSVFLNKFIFEFFWILSLRSTFPVPLTKFARAEPVVYERAHNTAYKKWIRSWQVYVQARRYSDMTSAASSAAIDRNRASRSAMTHICVVQ